MNQDERGYTIPENHQPDGMRCLQVYIPDDDVYFAAFMSAYFYFGKWLAWEKDGTTRAVEAAAIWKQAYELTRENIGEECMSTDVLVNAINNCCAVTSARLGQIANAIQQLNISSISNCNGCLSTNGGYFDEDAESYDPQNADFPPDFEDDATPLQNYYDSKCQWSNGLADSLITFISRISDAGFATAITIGAIAITGIISLIVPGILAITASGLLVIVGAFIALSGIAGFTWDIFAGIANYLLANRSELVCSFYESDNASDIVTNVRAVLYDAIDDAISSYTVEQQDDLRVELRLFVDAIVNNVTANLVFTRYDAGFFDLDYSGADCSGCPNAPSIYGWTDTDNFGGNDLDPFSGGNGVGLHLDVFYSGDGHVALKPTPAVDVETTATNNSWCGEFFITSPETKILREARVRLAHATTHAGQPSNNGAEIIFNLGESDEQVHVISESQITDDDYTEFVFFPNTVWSHGAYQNAITIRATFGGTFNAELKVGSVWLGLDEI